MINPLKYFQAKDRHILQKRIKNQRHELAQLNKAQESHNRVLMAVIKKYIEREKTPNAT